MAVVLYGKRELRLPDPVHHSSFALDHVGLAVRDLEKARLAYDRLGFTLSPRSMHSGSLEPGGPVVPWGSGNHCAMFKQGYFEVLGLVEPDKPSNVKRMLDLYDGLHIVAVGCPSADKAFSDFRTAGVAVPAPISLERDAAFGLRQESVRRARFKNLYPDSEAFPEARFIIIEHLTKDVLWQPHLLEHPNGAEALASVYFCVPDVDTTRNRLGSLFGAGEPNAAEQFTLSGGSLWLLTEKDIREQVPVLRSERVHRVAATGIAVRSLERLKSLFDNNGVVYVEAASLDSQVSLWVGPGEACNTALAFFQIQTIQGTQG